jgi:hypothetical protein
MKRDYGGSHGHWENGSFLEAHIIWNLRGSNVAKNGVSLPGSMINVVIVDDSSETCNSIADFEFCHPFSDSNDHTAAVATENGRVSVNFVSIRVQFFLP